jgi:hypothetical protein
MDLKEIKDVVKSKTFLTVAVACITVLALVFVVVGVLTHDEPTLINGVPRWERTDFRLGVSAMVYAPGYPEVAMGDDREVVESAMRNINHRLGFKALEWSGSSGRPDIVITMHAPTVLGDPPEEDAFEIRAAGGLSRILHENGRAIECHVLTSNTARVDVTLLAVEHEIGHCLGLAHDPYGNSIMRDPDVYPMEATPPGEFPPRITDADRRVLRRLYGPT